MNLLLSIFYTILRKAPKNRLFGTSLLLTTPVSLILLAFFIVMWGLTFSNRQPFNPIILGIFGIVTALFVNSFLKSIYQSRSSEIIRITNSFSNLIIIVNILITVIFYLGAVFIFVASLRFLS